MIFRGTSILYTDIKIQDEVDLGIGLPGLN